MERGDGTLANEASDRDAARFVGRTREREVIASTWASAPDAARICFVHGPGGVGKSALLRAIGRDAEDAGRSVIAVDGRVVGGSLADLEAALLSAAPHDVVIIDQIEALTPLGPAARDIVLSTLAAGTAVILAGRRPPGRVWFDAGAEHLVVTLALHPLSNDESRALLDRHGVADPASVDALIEWSGGFPLALAVAARARFGNAVSGTVPNAADLGERLIDQLAGPDLDGVDPLVLEVAALARTVDAQMLAAVLPGRSTRSSLQRLRESSIAEQVGPRVAVHAALRQAVRDRAGLGAQRRSELILRLAEHLATRIPDDPDLAIDLADLVQDTSLRAVVMATSSTFVVDRVRPHDAEEVLTRWGGVGTDWGERLRRWMRTAPGFVTIVRNVSGELAGVGIGGPLDRTPPWATHDPELGPVLEVAEALGVADDALFLHDMHLTGVPGSSAFDEARQVLIGSISIRHGVSRRHMFFTGDEPMPADCAAVFGFSQITALDRDDGERALRTWTADMGPNGTVGELLRAVASEQGAEPSPLAATVDGRRAHALVDALRHFHDDEVLRRNPLATGASVGQEAEQVRASVHAAMEHTFANAGADLLLRQVIELTYLVDPGGTRRAMTELHMSRSSLFRHLKRGRERLMAQASGSVSIVETDPAADVADDASAPRSPSQQRLVAPTME